MSHVDPKVRLVNTGRLRVDIVMFNQHNLAEKVATMVLRGNASDNFIAREKDGRAQDVLVGWRIESVN